MDESKVLEFLEKNPKNAYSYREIAKEVDKPVRQVMNAVRRLSKKGKLVRYTAKVPWTTCSGRVVQQTVAFFTVKNTV